MGATESKYEVGNQYEGEVDDHPPVTVNLVSDVLSLVLDHLDNHSLTQCLRVNHLFYSCAGPVLYRRDLVFGVQSGPGTMLGLTPFEGLQVYPWDRWLGRRQGQSSPTKLALLAHSRSMTLYPHRCHLLFLPPITLPQIKRLDIRTHPRPPLICPSGHPPIQWPYPILSAIRPSLVRIYRDKPCFMAPLSLSCISEDSIEHIQIIHGVDFFAKPVLGSQIHIEWPDTAKRIDFIYEHPIPRRSDWPDGPQAIPEHETAIIETVEKLETTVNFLFSATYTKAKLRVIGLPVSLWRDIEATEEYVETVGSSIREYFREALKSMEVPEDEARRRAMEVEMITLEDYYEALAGGTEETEYFNAC